MKIVCSFALVLAWVLWMRTQGPGLDDWTGVSGFATEAHCLANMKEKLDSWRQFPAAKIGRNSVAFPGQNTSMTYSCLTDSEDPRLKRRKP